MPDKKQDPTVNGHYEKNKALFANLYGTFGSNPILEESGVVLPYTLDDGTVIRFKLRRAGVRNNAWKKTYNEVVKPHEERVKDGTIPEEEMKGLLAVVYSKAVVIGWEGIKDSKGKDVPYSPETALDLLRFYPDLFTLIINDAHDRANFREEQLVQTEKN